MKFALIVFLGLFAISAQAKPTETVEALLPESIYSFVSELLAAAGVLNEKVQSTIQVIKEITESVIYQGVQKASDTWAKVEQELKKYDGGRTECIKKHLPALKEAKDKLETDIKKCVKPLVEKSEATKDDLKDSIKMVKESIVSFYDIAKECASFNPIQTVKCIHSHMGEFKEIIMDLIHDSEAKLESAIKGSSALSKESAICIKNALKEFNTTKNTIFESIKTCVEENKEKVKTY